MWLTVAEEHHPPLLPIPDMFALLLEETAEHGLGSTALSFVFFLFGHRRSGAGPQQGQEVLESGVRGPSVEVREGPRVSERVHPLRVHNDVRNNVCVCVCVCVCACARACVRVCVCV
jgi:hypothetical protein